MNMFWNRTLRALAAGAAALGVAACGGGSDTVPPAPPAAIGSATIGPEGGTVQGPDGVSLIVPPEALAAPVTLRIARSAAGAPPLPEGVPADAVVYEITPHEQQFLRPVTVRFPGHDAANDYTVLVASAGGEWAAQRAAREGRDVQIDRLSLSYYVFSLINPFLGCAVPVNNTDPYPCTPASLSSGPIAATPPRALVEQLGTPATIVEASTLHFDMRISAPRDCNNAVLQVDRWTTAGGLRPQPVFTRPIALSPDPLARNYSQGQQRVDAPLSFADNGWVTYAFRFSCTRSYNGARRFALAYFGARVNIAQPPGAPSITQQPASLMVVEGQNAAFGVRATAPDSLAIDWERSNDNGATWASVGTGAAVPGGSDLSFVTQLTDNNARLRAQVCNVRGTGRNCIASNAATLGVTPFTVAPSFDVDPTDLSIIAGQTASFTAAASGTPAPGIFWQVAAPGSSSFADVSGEPACAPTRAPGSGTQTTSVCTIAQTSTSISGSRYRAVARNAGGDINSGEATLTVNPGATAPTITQQPQPQTTVVGGSANFGYVATGSAPLSPEWRMNGTALPAGGGAFTIGACTGSASYSANALALTNLSAGCDGVNITVFVSNGVGPGVSSNAAVLTVNPTSNGVTVELDFRTGLDLPQAGIAYGGGAAVLDNGNLRLLGLTDLRAGSVTSIGGVAGLRPVPIGGGNFAQRTVLYSTNSAGSSCFNGNELRAVAILQGSEGGTWVSPPALLHTAAAGLCIFTASGAHTPRGFEFAVTASDGSLTTGTFTISLNDQTNTWNAPSVSTAPLTLPAACTSPSLDSGRMAGVYDVGLNPLAPTPARIAVLAFSGGSSAARSTCAATLASNGSWSAAAPVWDNGLDTNGSPLFAEPAVAMDNNGNALLAGSRRANNAHELAAAFLPVSSAQWQIEPSQPTFGQVLPALEFDRDGIATLLYRTQPTAADTFTTVYAARRAADGSWGARQRLMAGNGDTRFPRLSVASNGEVLALFQYAEAPAPFQVYAARFAGGSWGTPQPLQPTGSPAGRFAVGARHWALSIGFSGMRVYWIEIDPGNPLRARIVSARAVPF